MDISTAPILDITIQHFFLLSAWSRECHIFKNPTSNVSRSNSNARGILGMREETYALPGNELLCEWYRNWASFFYELATDRVVLLSTTNVKRSFGWFDFLSYSEFLLV
ncbi:hypothetical protein CEXT_280211 [Caerostris extrusa]|uniref:Maturase K n=1 Tax=Caerostris extrusa TaxID=172846 RepID=A0AAV4NG25_CAEEX|nr:hypothetical protein CEXT_280211 [Caerostris extrusa]